MLKAMRKLSGKLRRSTKGNAAMLVAIGTPMLMGGAGLAVDTAQWYLWKRELQHGVDQAAISAAWSMSKVETQEYYKYRAKQEYEAALAVTKDFAKDPVVTLAN
ncbi:MAG: TadE/TadG family type IV pilus assembly protein [Altererythrobacter sp.]